MQQTVFVVLEGVEHMALATFLRQRAVARQGLVFGIQQFLLHLVDGNQILLTLVSEGDIDDGEDHDQHDDADMMAYHLGRQEITTEDGAQGGGRRELRVFLLGVLLDLLERLLRLSLPSYFFLLTSYFFLLTSYISPRFSTSHFCSSGSAPAPHRQVQSPYQRV